eukprot:3400109-Pleurochrysis_carterae.AAC.1
MDGGEAHGTWFKSAVECSSVEPPRSKLGRSCTQYTHLCVSRRVLFLLYPITISRDQLSVAHESSADWYFATSKCRLR